jgi:6-phosphogluconolactonase/glucosamine-6-phosphate isomerase/deaminase
MRFFLFSILTQSFMMDQNSPHNHWIPHPTLSLTQSPSGLPAKLASPIQKRGRPLPEQIEATLQSLCYHLQAMANASIAHHGFFAWAIPGGSTVHQIFDAMDQSKLSENFPWKRIHFFWSDERNVPYDAPESNYGNIAKRLLGYGVPEKHLFPIPVHPEASKEALDTPATAQKIAQYDQVIKGHTHQGSFDLLLLGMGADGHFASIFPEDKMIQEYRNLSEHSQSMHQNELSYHAISYAFPARMTQPEVARVSLTLHFILFHSRQIAFCLLDPKKKPVFQQAINHADQLLVHDPIHCPSEIFKLLAPQIQPYWFVIPDLVYR